MISIFLGNKILDGVLGAAALAAPANIRICLYTSMPTVSGGGTEVSGGAYAPVVKSNDLTNFPSADDRMKTNGTLVTFPVPTADWGDIAGVVLKDHGSGDFLISEEFITPVNVAIGEPLQFGIGSLTFFGDVKL